MKNNLRKQVLTYGKKKYHSEPEYLWEDTPDAVVLRRGDNRKWYALIMKVGRARLGLSGEGEADVLNIKCDPDMVSVLKSTKGFLPAYHMSKTKWISVLLDGTVEENTILDLLDQSFLLTAPKKPGKKAAVKTAQAAPANGKDKRQSTGQAVGQDAFSE